MPPDVEGLVKFLCDGKLFNEERVRNGAKKLDKARSTQTQGRLDSYFSVLPSTPNQKRKVIYICIFKRICMIFKRYIVRKIILALYILGSGETQTGQ